MLVKFRIHSSPTYLDVVLVAAGLAVTGFLFSGAAFFGFGAPVVVDADSAPGRSEVRLVLAGAALTGSFATVGFGSALGAMGLAAGGFTVTGFEITDLVLAATGLGLAAGGAVADLGVVGALGIDLGTGLLLAAILEAETFAVDMAAGFLISIFVFATGVPFALVLLSAAFGAAAGFGVEMLDERGTSDVSDSSCAPDTVASSVGIAGLSDTSS
jgi:hypothetical protein